jgi:thiol-disulfide isomerase/thioredoxin
MKTKLVLTIIISLIISVSCKQQNKKGQDDSGKPASIFPGSTVNIGDNVPDISIPKIINSDKSSAEISDYKDKLLILDFWSTGCSGCIKGLPLLDELQKKFGDRIAILPVTPESDTLISKFLKKNKYTKNLTLPMVVEDKALGEIFRYKNITHDVWIYKGKLIAVTGSEYADDHNIQLILDGKSVNWPVKNDFLPPFNYDKPLHVVKPGDNSDKGNPSQYSVVLGYIPDATSKQGTSYDSVTHARRIYFVNFSILPAYIVNWYFLDPKTNEMPANNQIVLEVKDRTKYCYNEDPNDHQYDPKWGYRAEWNIKNQISYESVAIDLKQDPKEQYRTVIRDLDRLLGLSGRWEIRKTKCLILVNSRNNTKLKTNGGDYINTADSTIKKYKNAQLQDFVWRMNEYSNNPRVIDETNYKGNVDMELDFNSWEDIPAIRKALQKYGLDLKEEVRDLRMFVLTEKNASSPKR